VRCPEEVGVAALALGVLDSAEQIRLGAHVDGCAECSRSLHTFASLPQVLDRIGPDAFAAPPTAPTEAGFQRLRLRAEQLRRQRRRGWVAAAAAAAVLLAGGAVVAVRAVDGPARPSASVSASSGPVRAWATYTPDNTGTAIRLTLSGVLPHERCRLVAVGRDGHRETASTWTASYDGTATVDGTVSLAARAIDRLVVETTDGHVLVTLSSAPLR